MKSKKALITVFELPFVLLLFISTYPIIVEQTTPAPQEYQTQVEMFMNLLSKNQTFRQNIQLENLSTSLITQNWNSVQTKISTQFPKYSLEIKENSLEKSIFTCNITLGKVSTQRIISIHNQGNFSLRTALLGVCY